MATPQTKKRPSRPRYKEGKTKSRLEKRKDDLTSLEALDKAVAELDPKTAQIKKFSDLPLSEPTSSGLQASHFQVLTEIQAGAIPLALKGLDVLGAARTGSGKTLAFLVPVLEKLYRARWTEFDGLGALIISPTRELAVQIFEVLRKIGRNHTFSAGLIIGGKSLKEEAERLERMNILVCTPGRMLQHLDQTAGFATDNLQVLVLDEADRIMDMGFQHAVDALVDHLPITRQTMMFSATQSKRVSDLARLSLKDPEYVSVHKGAETATPATLQQHYVITPLAEKLDTLYGFIKANLKSKIIVFFSSGKQVRFAYESFRHLQPGIPLLHLHGRQKQLARLEITNRFTSSQNSCLFATDVVARGVDFPQVDWVIQVDCPEDADTYIHRVGRTARYESTGRAVLFLDPSEEGMLKRLEQKKVPIQRVNVKEKMKKNLKDELQNICFQFPDVKYLGQKAFISYAKSIYLQKDKEVFKMNELDLDAFAASLGLPGTPLIKFQKGEDVKKLKNAPRMNWSSGSESEFDLDGRKEPKDKKKKKKEEVRTKYDRMFERTNQDVFSAHYTKMLGEDGEKGEEGREESDDENFLSVKRVLNEDDLDSVAGKFGAMPKVIDLGGAHKLVIDSKRREKLLKSKKKMLKYQPLSKRLVFDDDGNTHEVYELQDEDDFKQDGPVEEQRRQFLEGEASRAEQADADDKEVAKRKRREKREKQKLREQLEREGLPPDSGAGANKRKQDGEVLLEGGEDPASALDFLRSLPVAGKSRHDDSDSPDSEDERPKKKPKKWFQDDSDDEAQKSKRKGKSRVIEMEHEPENLEDLEALATGLLDD